MSKNNRVRIFVRTRPTPNFAHGMIDFLQDGKAGRPADYMHLLLTDKQHLKTKMPLFSNSERINTIKVHTQRDEKEKIVDNQLLDWSFKVDGILHNANQDQVYDEVASKMVTRSLNGYNGTLMAYGQTGAGKTFTITGATENFKQRGIIPRAISQVFKEIEEQVDNVVTVRISYLEIYNENMFDLLSTLPASGSSAYYDIQSMTIVEGDNGSVSVKGLSLHAANNEGEALNLLFEGETNRVIAAHSLNKNSSRSHCIFTIHIESRSRTQSSAKYVASKLNLVDLAGSERIGKTGSQGQILREAMYINKSLSFLEQTVIALADKNRDHVPFRQTKLTHALKDSLGGKCMTSMVANIYGEADQLEETISTLRFAMRMKRVAVEPAINDHYDPWILIKELKGEISHLKQELSMHNTLANHAQVQYDPLTEGQINYIRKQVKTFLEGKAAEIDVSNLRQINTVFAQFRSVVLSMEEATHTKVRQKYVLIDKNNADAMAAIQRSGIPLDEDGNYINMVDSSIGSLGVAASTAGVTTAPSKAKTTSNQNQQQSTAAAVTAAKRKSGKKSRAGGSPTGRGVSSPAPQSEVKGGKLAPSAVADTESVKKEGSLASADSHTDDKKMSRPSTPPTRAQAFEEFKNEKGQEISRILSENKSILQSKKRMVKDIAHAVNATKQMIDGTRISLEEKRRERIEQGEFVNEDGETVIDEEEFLLISELKKLKQQYRIDYEEMRNVKSEVEYCQKLVDQCRQRLVQEFDAWYSENFLGEPVIASASVGFGIRPGVHPPARLQLTTRQANIEDEQEKFDRLQQQVLLENPDSAAFYNAKLNMHRRHLNEKSYSQGQPHPGEHAIGIPNASMRSRLPNQFSMVNVPTY